MLSSSYVLVVVQKDRFSTCVAENAAVWSLGGSPARSNLPHVDWLLKLPIVIRRLAFGEQRQLLSTL